MCLFDFGLSAIDDWGQFKNWRGWIGQQQQSRVPVWLEIDRDAIAENLWDAGTARREWDKEGRRSATFIPGVEACHKGPIAVGMIDQVLFVDQHDLDQFGLGDMNNAVCQRIAEFEQGLPPAPEEHAYLKIVEARARRLRRSTR